MNSANNFEGTSPRKVLLEQLSRILPADDSLPDQVRVSVFFFGEQKQDQIPKGKIHGKTPPKY